MLVQRLYPTVTLAPRDNVRLVIRSGTLISGPLPKGNVQMIVEKDTLRTIQTSKQEGVRNVTSFVQHVPDSSLRHVPHVFQATS